MAYLIHGHICQISEAKIKRLTWIYATIMFIFVYDIFTEGDQNFIISQLRNIVGHV